MPKIANRNQQVYTGGVYPISAYSRVIGLTALIPPNGDFGFNVTPQVGNKVWLTHIKIQVLPKPANHSQGTSVIVYAGQGGEPTQNDLLSWEVVIPMRDPAGGSTLWTMTDGISVVEWDFSKLYKGKNRRFAVGGRRYGGFGADGIWASLTIAEG
jgi:hypothetical protein